MLNSTPRRKHGLSGTAVYGNDYSSWRSDLDWIDRMKMTFVTGCSRISFHPRPCLQKRNIGPSTEINDYSFWTLRGQSL
jgi:hypothetical protein